MFHSVLQPPPHFEVHTSSECNYAWIHGNISRHQVAHPLHSVILYHHCSWIMCHLMALHIKSPSSSPKGQYALATGSITHFNSSILVRISPPYTTLLTTIPQNSPFVITRQILTWHLHLPSYRSDDSYTVYLCIPSYTKRHAVVNVVTNI